MDGDSGDEGNDELIIIIIIIITRTMFMVLSSWCVRDQIRVIGLHDQEAGEFPWETDYRDRVMHDEKSSCWPSERKRKVS